MPRGMSVAEGRAQLRQDQLPSKYSEINVVIDYDSDNPPLDGSDDDLSDDVDLFRIPGMTSPAIYAAEEVENVRKNTF